MALFDYFVGDYQRPQFLNCSMKLRFLLWMVLAFALSTGCKPFKKTPKANNGYLDLSAWDLRKDGNIKLDGEWAFYPDQLLTPAEIQKDSTAHKPTYLKVPGFWNIQQADQKSGLGYGTYHLRVKGHFPAYIGLYILDVGSAYRLWVNDSLVATNGVVGTSVKQEVPEMRPEMRIIRTSDEMDIVVQISNFFHSRGGIWKSWSIGTTERLLHQRDVSIIGNIFLVGVFIILFIYQMFVFFLRRSEYTAFWFGIFCLFVAVRVLVIQDRYIYVLFPHLSLNFTYRLEYLSAFETVVIWGFFLHTLFPSEFPKTILRIFGVTAIVEGILIIFPSTYFYTNLLPAFQLVSVLILLYYLVVLGLALRHRRTMSGFLFLSLMVVLVAVANDILYERLVINTGLFIQHTAFLFVIVQAYLLAKRISKAYQAAETLSAELNQANINLEHKVMERTSELEAEKKKADDLLLNILPAEMAEELKTKGRSDTRSYGSVTVMFTDMVGFTMISEQIGPEALVAEIDHCFSAFDRIVESSGLEKIKTIGDAYMCAAGLPVPGETNAVDIVHAAQRIIAFMEQRKKEKLSKGETPFEIRIGIHTGPVIAGIVGVRKFAYDIWGDTVNTAARMEQNSHTGKINISGTTYDLVKDHFKCSYRGKIDAKNKGMIDMYFVEE
jgi:class 3 adenylate cyclase